MNESTIKFAEVLSRKIKERGITKAELSRMIDVSNTTITNYTKGRVRPHPLLLQRLAMVFNCRISELYHE